MVICFALKTSCSEIYRVIVLDTLERKFIVLFCCFRLSGASDLKLPIVVFLIYVSPHSILAVILLRRFKPHSAQKPLEFLGYLQLFRLLAIAYPTTVTCHPNNPVFYFKDGASSLRNTET